MKYAEILRGQVAALEQERNALLSELDGFGEFDPTADGESRSQADVDGRITAILERGSAIKDEIADKTKQAADLDALEAERTASPTFMRKPDKPAATDMRSMSRQQLTDTIVRAAEERDIDPTTAKMFMRKHGSDRDWLQSLAVRSTDVYQSAFVKMVTERQWALTDEERAAIAVGTNTQGGFLVPTYLDPTIILTNTNNNIDVIRPIATVKTLTTGNAWTGVTTAGVSASWDGELVEVSDDTPGFASVSIPLKMAQAFVQASIPAFEDIDGLAGDVLMLFQDARSVLEAAAHMTGNGTTAPKGIFTALDANTNVEIISTTAATISVVDLELVKRSLPQRWRQQARWVYNPLFGDTIRNLGTALSNVFSVYLPEENTEKLLGNGVSESDSAPSTLTTTVSDNEIILGDFSQYYIVDKPGSMSVEFIPHLFNTTTNLPDGRRGWYAHWRTGADAVNPLAFRLYQDKTSA